MKTNLIKRDDSRDKFDLYSSLIKDVHNTVYKKVGYEKARASIIKRLINRSLIKSLYMPLVYGKSMYSAAQDILKSPLGRPCIN